jgi:hypothetical protein
MIRPHPDAMARPETTLEEGLRRYAPREFEGRRVAISDFVVSLLLTGLRRSGAGR